ncbi:MAG: hypothetical protein IJZ68_06885 [Bacteroidaceae bacterium]|nr:hypothetical protein [Bacteroidaceae bacterium]
MPFNSFKHLIACVLCLVIMTSLCACSPYIDQEFIDLNMTAQTKPTETPTEPDVTEPPVVKPEATEPEESTPAFKPGGFILPDDEPEEETTPIVDEPEDTEPTNPGEEPKPTQPQKPSVGNVDGVKISAGMKAALNSLGKTTTTRVTVFQPAASADGSQTIIHIKNNGNKATQYTYMYYETTDAYAAASSGVSTDACNDELRMILRGEMEVLPVTNPETMGIVLFDGYLLWR